VKKKNNNNNINKKRNNGNKNKKTPAYTYPKSDQNTRSTLEIIFGCQEPRKTLQISEKKKTTINKRERKEGL